MHLASSTLVTASCDAALPLPIGRQCGRLSLCLLWNPVLTCLYTSYAAPAAADGDEGEEGAADEDCGAEFKPLVQLDEVEVQVRGLSVAFRSTSTPLTCAVWRVARVAVWVCGAACSSKRQASTLLDCD